MARERDARMPSGRSHLSRVTLLPRRDAVAREAGDGEAVSLPGEAQATPRSGRP